MNKTKRFLSVALLLVLLVASVSLMLEANAACAHPNPKVTAPTCAASGKTVCQTCSVTLATKPALGHNFSVVQKSPTCTAAGSKKCSRCTATTNSPAALGHNFSVVQKSPTCTAAGVKKCSRCTSTTNSPAALGHDYDQNTNEWGARCSRCQ